MSDIERYLENPIKRHIITSLLKNARQRYSQLQPSGVDNVLFNYHLQHLVKTGVLIKEDQEYVLSPEGIQLTSSISYEGVYSPKFVCRYQLYLIDTVEGKVLFAKKVNAPWRGDITPLSSKLLVGTPTNLRANTRMKDKTGLDCDMRSIGTLRQLVVNEAGNLLDDCIYIICYGTQFSGKLNGVSDDKDELTWLKFSEAKAIEAKNEGSGPAAIEILNRFEKNDFSPFFFEETIVSKMF